jgi:hypothetical protein
MHSNHRGHAVASHGQVADAVGACRVTLSAHKSPRRGRFPPRRNWPFSLPPTTWLASPKRTSENEDQRAKRRHPGAYSAAGFTTITSRSMRSPSSFSANRFAGPHCFPVFISLHSCNATIKNTRSADSRRCQPVPGASTTESL